MQFIENTTSLDEELSRLEQDLKLSEQVKKAEQIARAERRKIEEQREQQIKEELDKFLQDSPRSKIQEEEQVKNSETSKSPFSWLEFFLQAEFDEMTAKKLSTTFTQNELDENDLKELDHELLQSLGVTVAKNRLKILKARNVWIDKM